MTDARSNPRKALGKGLSALLGPRTESSAALPPSLTVPAENTLVHIPLDSIDPNPVQCRTVFHSENLAELAQSIRVHGIIQPLVVRRHGARFQLIAGERRWRAARLAGLEKVPALIRELDDDRLLEATLIENIQREDLSPIEIARAFERLHREAGLSHEEIARRTGKDRTTVTNLLRLLRLPTEVQQLIAESRISMGHARALLALPTPDLQTSIANKVAREGLSVRQVERLVQKLVQPSPPETKPTTTADPNVKAATADLERSLGTRVRIVFTGESRGRIEIEFFSQEELQRLYELLCTVG